MYKNLSAFTLVTALALVVGCGGPLPTESEGAALEQSSAALSQSDAIVGSWHSDGWTAFVDHCTSSGWLTASPVPQCNQIGQTIFSNIQGVGHDDFGTVWYTANRWTGDGVSACGLITIRVAIGVYTNGQMIEYVYGSNTPLRIWTR